MAKYDGNTLTVIANPSALDAGYQNSPLAIGTTLYFRYADASNTSYNVQLAKYDGNTLTVIANPSASDNGYYGSPIAIGNTLYFRYHNAANKYQLAKYDGNTLTVIANPSASDLGYNDSPIAIGTTLYFRYYNAAGKYQLAKYDGNTLTVIANPSSQDAGYQGNPIAIGNILYFSYQNAAGYFQLGQLNTLLPVSLLNFSAQSQNSTVVLNWQTTNEVNASHFTIERSLDGTNFTNIGKVVAKGKGIYSYMDNQLPTASTIYYRLQILDKDGSYTYSKVVAVTVNDNRKTLVLFPNPVTDNLFVQFTSVKAEKLTLQVTDLQGRVLQQTDAQVSVGNISLSINTATLPKGSYVLLVKGVDGTQQHQFIK